MRASFRHLLLISSLLPGTIAVLASSAVAQPLHQRINSTLDAVTVGPVAQPVDDLHFARRAYLDLTGQIPSSEESRAFLALPEDSRRTQLVDQLLASDEYVRHMAATFEVMLMERRGNKHVKTEALRSWLHDAFAENRPFHELARDLIAADTSSKVQPPAAFFLERDAEPNLMAREISRMFFGRDIQCAQCHDHPNVDDYKQEDFFGMYAFVSRTSLFRPDKKKPAVLSESADGQAPFKSVFTNREAFTSPRMPGEAEITEPVFPAGQEYHSVPSKTVAGVPKYSRRAKLAELIGSGQNSYFRRNIANRLWAMVMGRGLVHPVDMHHSMNPPSHPELMDLLADEFAAMNFDVQLFLRELVLSDVYQRQHLLLQQPTPEAPELLAAAQQLEARKEAADAVSTAKDKAAQAAMEELDEVIAKAEPLRAAWAKARAAAVAAAGKQRAAEQTKQTRQSAVTQKQTLTSHLSEALAKAQAASSLLGQPAELKTVTTALKSREDKSVAELRKLQTELDAAVKAATAAADGLAKAQATDSTEQQKLIPLQQQMHTHRTHMVTAFRESQQAYERVTHAEEKAEYLKQLLAKHDASEKMPVMTREATVTQQQREAAMKNMSQAEQQLAEATQQMTAADTAQKAAALAAQQLTQRMQQAEQANQMLLAAMQNAKAAAELLPQDAAMSQLTEQLQTSTQRVAGMMGETQTELAAATTRLQQTEAQIADLKAKAATAKQHAAAAKQQATDLSSQLTELQSQLATLSATRDEAQTAVEQHAVRQFHMAPIEALTAEQLAWSILQASGQLQRQVDSELAKLNKEKPLPADKQIPADLEARRIQAERAASDALEKTVAGYVPLFAAQAGQPQDDFFATVDQALFFANGGQLRSWLAPAGGNLTDRLLKLETPEQIAHELYLTTLVRRPDAAEIQEIADYLKSRGEQKSDAVQELAWALITSAEFRFHY